MKRLVVCFDGTWNRPDDKGNSTNVVKIMRAIRDAAEDGTQQVTFYDKGVGTGGPIDRFLGGATGRGVGENVRDGYRFLANNYVPGDEVYIFGFSRGAFTGRSLAGFIGACGLLDKHSMGELMRTWEFYRTPPHKRSPTEQAEIQGLGQGEIRIKCVGVWDTVGALGMPVESLKWMNRGKYAFHDTTLGANIDCALHAMAIDEKRGPFAPTLWQGPEGGHRDRDQIVEQVWFSGVHSNVGGSYEDAGLSDLALDWMIKRVREHTPLEFDDDYVRDHIHGDAAGTSRRCGRNALRIPRGAVFCQPRPAVPAGARRPGRLGTALHPARQRTRTRKRFRQRDDSPERPRPVRHDRALPGRQHGDAPRVPAREPQRRARLSADRRR